MLALLHSPVGSVPLSIPRRLRSCACAVNVRHNDAMKRAVRSAILGYSVRNRRKKGAEIVRFMQANGLDTLLLCGSMPQATGQQRNVGIVERAVAKQAERVVGFDIEPRDGGQPWPIVVADGRQMPFATRAFDVVVANAVIEHVGGEPEQRRFVAEHARVARALVITTPNRWFPVESHTSVLIKHWSASWRGSRREFTRLLSRREFRALLPEGSVVRGLPWSPTFTAFYISPG